jgi:hypothetical protein
MTEVKFLRVESKTTKKVWYCPIFSDGEEPVVLDRSGSVWTVTQLTLQYSDKYIFSIEKENNQCSEIN